MDSSEHITTLLNRVQAGERAAEDELLVKIEPELRLIADARMRRERKDHTLQATVLIDEVFLRLCGAQHVEWKDRRHFYRAAARAMRRYLIDHERARRAGRRPPPELLRGGGAPEEIARRDDGLDVLALHDALNKLAVLDSRQADVIELHHFGGYTFEETAEILGVSIGTVKRDWKMGKAWLHRELSLSDER